MNKLAVVSLLQRREKPYFIWHMKKCLFQKSTVLDSINDPPPNKIDADYRDQKDALKP